MSAASMTAASGKSSPGRTFLLFALVGSLFLFTGFWQSWNLSLQIFNMALISSIMALGVNMQWGYAGLFSVGTMGFVALGGLAVVLVSSQPVPGAWALGGPGILLSLVLGAGSIAAAIFAHGRMKKGRLRTLVILAILVIGFIVFRALFDPNVKAVELNDPARAGNLGGLGLPVLLAWPAGGLLAAVPAAAVGPLLAALGQANEPVNLFEIRR